jgi:hypothetical protein
MKKKSLALLTTTTFLATLGLTVQTPAQTIVLVQPEMER